MWLGVKCCVSEHLCLFFLILLVIAGNIFHGEDLFLGGWEVLIIFILTFLNLENAILLWVTMYEHKTFMLIED